MRTAINEGTSPPEQEAPNQAAPSTGSPLALRNWRVRTRLIALILIPTTVAVLLGALRVTTSISSAAQYERVNNVAELVNSLATLAHEFQDERDKTVAYIAAGRPQGPSLVAIRNQQDAVDGAVTQVRAKAGPARDALSASGRQRLQALLNRLNDLGTLRNTAIGTKLPPLPAMDRYSLVISDMLQLYEEIRQGSTNEELSATASALGALARAKEETSRQRGLLAAALARRPVPRFTPMELDAFNSADAGQDSQLIAFGQFATLAQSQLYADTVTGQKVDRAEGLKERAKFLTDSGRPLRRLESANTARDAELWYDAMTDTVDRMHRVENELIKQIITKSDELQGADQGFAALNVILVAGLLILVLIVTSVVARSLVRPLRRLRAEALDIAGNRLPAMVARLREADAAPANIAAEVKPISVASSDEIGEVARAFDEVHREAVRLAGDEAALRSNISAMFVNLSRRTQTLVERQISLIDSLEQGEQDEQRLANLFKLDHLATRMRRNSENLLVLAGQEPARRWSQPVPLVDVVRASLSEVENYERVDVQVLPGVAVAGQAVNDVIHLLAELIENAISFSSRDTKVTVTANRIDGGGVMIGITDHGIGMTAEELAQANWRLSNPPVVDVSVSRRMGLFVVGRLALRHGIRVQLRPHDGGGLTAMVLLPETLVGVTQPAMPFGQSGAFAAGMASAQVGGGSGWDASGDSGRFSAGDSGRFGTATPALEEPSRPGALQGAGLGSGSSQGSDSARSLESTQSFGAVEGFAGASSGAQPSGASGPQNFSGGFGQGFGGSGSSSSTSQELPSGVQTFDTPSGPVFTGPQQQQTDGGGESAFGSAFTKPAGATSGGSSGQQGFDTPSGPVFGGSGQQQQQTHRPGQQPSFSSPPPAIGRMRSRRFDFPDPDASSTGPMPSVSESSPMEQQKEEYLPIFAAVESAWFRRAPANSSDENDPSGGWRASSADAGWQAAQVVRDPVREGKTASGLPKRIPKANLVPGSVPTSDAGRQSGPQRPLLSPDRARSRLASFQQGIRQGRAVARGELSEDEAYPSAFRRFDEGKEDA